MSWLTKTARVAALAALAFSTPVLTGCAAVALTAGSLAAGTGISHTLSGVVSKTFTAPMKTVEYANLRALKDMGIDVVGRETNEEGERVVTAEAKDRQIEILLEPLSSRTTRIRATARDGFLQDGATATEIILQTERVLAKG
jgi:hypothetical protein